MDKSLDDALKQLNGLFKEREASLEKREKDLQRQKTALEQEYPNAGSPSDVLDLDVGGTHLSVLRRTLTQVEGSMLASMFSGRWDDRIEKTKDDRIFIDRPIELFLPMVNYLRELAFEVPLVRPPKPPVFGDAEMRHAFYRMVEVYGMRLGLYRLGVYQLDSSGAPSTLVGGHPDYETRAGGTFSNFCLLPLDNRHTMYINSFEVKVVELVDEASAPKIGFVRHGNFSSLPSTNSGGKSGVGYGTYSIAWDLGRSGISVNNGGNMYFYDVANTSVTTGSVIRCEDRGNKWYIDGVLVASTNPQDSVTQIPTSLVVSITSANVIPCVSLVGAVEFTAIEFLYT